MCIHLEQLEKYIVAAGFKETWRGQPWTTNCHEWVYYNCIFNTKALMDKLKLASVVSVHDYFDAKAGSELGFVCTQCHDAIIGPHPKSNNIEGLATIA
jgi:hypothetical protein